MPVSSNTSPSENTTDFCFNYTRQFQLQCTRQKCIRNAVVHKIPTNNCRLQSFDQFIFVASCKKSPDFQLALQICHLISTTTDHSKSEKNDFYRNLCCEIYLHFGYIVVGHSSIDVFVLDTVCNIQ